MFRWMRKIKNCFEWLPIIWQDEDWQCEYLYKIMSFKIKRIRKEMTESPLQSIHIDKYIRDMKVAEELLSRMAEGEDRFYWENNYEQCEFSQKMRAHGCPKDEMFCCPMIDCEYCMTLRKFQHQRQDAKEKADAAYLWKIMAKESKKWWD